MAPDVGEHRVLFRTRDALTDGQIDFFHGTAGELADE